MTKLASTRFRWTGLVMVLTVLSPAVGFAQTVGGLKPSNVTVQNYEAVGNLANTHVLKCTTLDKMTSEDTPVDIYPAFADCVENGRYQEATSLFMLAGAYGAFDALRVSDVTAREAKTVLVMESMGAIDPAKKAAWNQALKAYIGGSGLAEGCAAIRRLGPPTYYPTYMIQHGMAALNGNNPAPLVTPFDPVATWQTVQATYLQCPGAAPSQAPAVKAGNSPGYINGDALNAGVAGGIINQLRASPIFAAIFKYHSGAEDVLRAKLTEVAGGPVATRQQNAAAEETKFVAGYYFPDMSLASDKAIFDVLKNDQAMAQKYSERPDICVAYFNGSISGIRTPEAQSITNALSAVRAEIIESAASNPMRRSPPATPQIIVTQLVNAYKALGYDPQHLRLLASLPSMPVGESCQIQTEYTNALVSLGEAQAGYVESIIH